MTCYVGQDLNNSEKLSNVEFAEQYLEDNGMDAYIGSMGILISSLYNQMRTIVGGGKIGFTSQDAEFLSSFRDRLYAMLKVLENIDPNLSMLSNYPDIADRLQETIDYMKEWETTVKEWNPSVGDLAYSKWKQGYRLLTGKGEHGRLISPEDITYFATDRGLETEQGELLTTGNGKMPGWILPAAIGGAVLFFAMR